MDALWLAVDGVAHVDRKALACQASACTPQVFDDRQAFLRCQWAAASRLQLGKVAAERGKVTGGGLYEPAAISQLHQHKEFAIQSHMLGIDRNPCINGDAVGGGKAVL